MDDTFVSIEVQFHVIALRSITGNIDLAYVIIRRQCAHLPVIRLYYPFISKELTIAEFLCVEVRTSTTGCRLIPVIDLQLSMYL